MEPAQMRRNPHRAVHGFESIKSVFRDSFIAHVSYVDNGLPACLPMLAIVKEEHGEIDTANGPDHDTSDRSQTKEKSESQCNKSVVYLHGHPSARLMELVQESSREAHTQDGSDPASKSRDQVKVCIAATKVDGLVLSSAPNGHSLNYRCAIIHGTCSPVRDKTLKRAIMRDVTNHIVADRWEEVNPVASFQVSLVYVIKVTIDKMSMKARTGLPGIQPRDKEKDGPDHGTQPFTGVVPLYETLGAPVDSGLTPGGVVSESLQQYIERRNGRHQEYAEKAARG